MHGSQKIIIGPIMISWRQPSVFSAMKLDCKTVTFFFLKIAELSPFSASLPTFCQTVCPYLKTQKYGLFCSLKRWNIRDESNHMTRWLSIFVFPQNLHERRFYKVKALVPVHRSVQCTWLLGFLWHIVVMRSRFLQGIVWLLWGKQTKKQEMSTSSTRTSNLLPQSQQRGTICGHPAGKVKKLVNQ